MPEHHPAPEELLSYALGDSEPWLSALMAAHLTLCPHCRDEVAHFEALGGALLDEIPDELSVDAFGSMPAPEPPPASVAVPAASLAAAPYVPDGIARYVPRPLHTFMAESAPRFRLMAPGLHHIPLTLRSGERPVRLVRFKPGFVVPEHAHAGLEWLLILRGELIDCTTGQRFAKGDVSRRGTADVHKQVIGKAEPCIAVFAHLAPPIPRTLLGKILSRVVGL